MLVTLGRGMSPLATKKFITLISKEKLSSHFTFSRETTASYVDKNGVLQIAAIDQPRFEYNADGVFKGLLLEDIGTNNAPQSSTFDEYSNGDGYTVLRNAATGHAGSQTASLYLLSSSGSACWIGGGGSPDVSDYDYHSFAININRYGISDRNRYYTLSYRESSGYTQRHGVIIDLQELTVTKRENGTATVGKVSVEDLGNDLYRIKAEGCEIDNETYSTLTLEMGACSSDGTILSSGTGNDTTGFVIENLQFEYAPYISSYIPTETDAVKRAADALSIDGDNYSKLFNSDKGTMYIEFYLNGDNGADQYLFTLNDGTSTIALGFRVLTSTLLLRAGGAGGNFFSSTNAVNIGEINKAALRWSGTELTIALNGVVSSISNGAIPSGLTQLSMGSLADALKFNGHFRRSLYYPKALASPKLEAMTA